MLTILTGDAIEQLRTLPDESVHCCVTSPPYWGLRDYGTAQWEGGKDDCDHVERNSPGDSGRCSDDNREGVNPAPNQSKIQYRVECPCGAKRIDSQLGLEKTPEEYVAKMVEVFREVRRVLRKDGTLWLNLGDSYASGEVGRHDKVSGGEFTSQWNGQKCQQAKLQTVLKPKDLCGIPWRVAFALQADRWWLRSDIIWAKPNPMPESVTDRPTKAHEYLFLLTKSANYFYDTEAIKEKAQYGFSEGALFHRTGNCEHDPERGGGAVVPGEGGSRNKRSVWTVATAPYPEAHFATYPPHLIKPCILAGTSAKGCCAKCGSPWERIVDQGELNSPSVGGQKYSDGAGNLLAKGKAEAWSQLRGGSYENRTIGWQPTCKCSSKNGLNYSQIIPATVLDPFAGSGTTGAVALELGRKAILMELNPKYVALIKQRCTITPGLALA